MPGTTRERTLREADDIPAWQPGNGELGENKKTRATGCVCVLRIVDKTQLLGRSADKDHGICCLFYTANGQS